MRRVLLLLTMAVGVALVAWAGWENWRIAHWVTRPLQTRVEQTSSAQGSAEPRDGADDVEASELQGRQAPEFALVDLAGKRVSLGDFKGRPLVINYWGTYCGPCRVEMPWLEEFSRKYASAGLAVVGITYDSEVGREKIARTVSSLGVSYPILLSDAATEKAYLSGTAVLPMSFYVDRTGRVIGASAGQGSKDDLEARVKETIAAGGR
jgi:thiol-disulfide isomerase/thioredoxin